MSAFYNTVRNKIFELLQNRALTLPTRIYRVGRLCEVLRETCSHFCTRDALSVLDSARDIAANFTSSDEISNASPDTARSILCDFVRELDSKSDSLDAFGEGALAAFDISSYAELRNILYNVLPNIDIFMEQVVVNHVFYNEFPFSDSMESTRDDFLSLAASYAVLRFLAVGLARELAAADDAEALICDIFASAFRFIECSNFDRRAASWLHSFSHDSDAEIRAILQF